MLAQLSTVVGQSHKRGLQILDAINNDSAGARQQRDQWALVHCLLYGLGFVVSINCKPPYVGYDPTRCLAKSYFSNKTLSVVPVWETDVLGTFVGFCQYLCQTWSATKAPYVRLGHYTVGCLDFSRGQE